MSLDIIAKKQGEDHVYALSLRSALQLADKTALIVHIRQSPRDVLAVIKDGDQYGLTDRDAADLFEEVLGAYDGLDVPMAVTKVIGFTSARLSELVGARGDLESLAMQALKIHVLVDAFFAALSSGSIRDLSGSPFQITRSWCKRLMEREDYAEFLAVHVTRKLTIFDILLLSIWDQYEEDPENPPAQIFVEFGLDADVARESFLLLVGSSKLLSPRDFCLDQEKLKLRRQKWAEKHRIVRMDQIKKAQERATEL